MRGSSLISLTGTWRCSAKICAVVMARLAGLLINDCGLIAYPAIRSAIFGAFLNPRALSGRSKSLTSKLQSDLACLIMNKCLAIILPFHLTVKPQKYHIYNNCRTALKKTEK